jgi:uncharacterized protein (TIGR00106 family)
MRGQHRPFRLSGRSIRERTGYDATALLCFRAKHSSTALSVDTHEENAEMKATADVQVVPLGVGVSVRKEVTRAHELLADSGLKVSLHAFGTNVEGELDDVLAAVKRVHEVLHAEGVVRITSSIKLGTRTDKEPTLEGKQL